MANKRGNITGLGNLTGLRSVTNTTAATTDTIIVDYEADEEDNDDIAIHSHYYKTMKISYNIYEQLRDHSHKYQHQPISYDEIIDELCTFYNKQYEKKILYNLTNNKTS